MAMHLGGLSPRERGNRHGPLPWARFAGRVYPRVSGATTDAGHTEVPGQKRSIPA